jgi:hypothetical protein
MFLVIAMGRPSQPKQSGSLDSSRQNSNSSHVRFRLAEIVPAGFEMNFGIPKFTFTPFFLLCEGSGFFCTDWHERYKFFPVIRCQNGILLSKNGTCSRTIAQRSGRCSIFGQDILHFSKGTAAISTNFSSQLSLS